MSKKNWLALIVAVCFATAGGTRYFLQITNDKKAVEAVLIEAMEEASPIGNAAYWQLPTDFDDIPQDPENPLTEAKAKLGEKLFFEPTLSTHNVGCNACHHPDAGFYAGVAQSVGFGGVGEGLERFIDKDAEHIDAPPIKSPTALNVAYRPNSLHSNKLGSGKVVFPVGGEDVELMASVQSMNQQTDSLWAQGSPLIKNHLRLAGAETQVFGAIGAHELDNLDSFLADPEKRAEYLPLFAAAFPEMSPAEYSTDVTIAKAIAAFERTLITTNNRFQRYLRGEGSLTLSELKGAVLAFTECAGCHNLPSFAGTGIYAMGHGHMWLRPDFFGDVPELPKGMNDRFSFTGNADDMCKYPPMQWYSVTKGNFYGHGSTYDYLPDFIRDHTSGVMQDSFLAEFADSNGFELDTLNLGLSDVEIEQLTDFILSLEED